MEEVEARLLTDLPEAFRLPTSTFSIPVSITPEGLSQLVKQQVDLNERLLFSVNNVVINTTLEDVMKAQKLTGESLLEIWYNLALPLPTPVSSHPCPDWVSSCVFLTPSTLLSTDFSGQISVFHNQQLTHTEQLHAFPIKSVAVTVERNLVATGAKDGTIRITAYRDREFESMAEGKLTSVERLAWNPSGTMVAAGLYSGEIHIVSINTEESAMLTKASKRQKLGSFGLHTQRLSIPHSDAISAIHWPELDVIYTASLDHSVIVWDIAQESAVFSYTAPRSIQSFHVSNRLLACGFENGDIRIMDERSSQVIGNLHTETYVRVLEWYRGGLLSGHEDGSMKVWDIRSSEPIESSVRHTDKVLTMAISESLLATGGADSTVQFHSLS